MLQRVQQAFAEGRLDDAEFDERKRAALTARTYADLDVLLTDLPAATAPGGAPPVGRGPGRLAVALKSSVRRAGRWRVPERYTAVVYKGDGWLDLRAAELSGPVTTFVAVAYKSRVTILVPPSVRVEMTGLGVTHGRGGRRGSGLPAGGGRAGDPRPRSCLQGRRGGHHTPAGTSRSSPVAALAGPAVRSAAPGPGLTAADVVRRFVERRIPELGVTRLA